MDERTKELLGEAKGTIAIIGNIDPQSIARKGDFGLLDFSDAVPYAERIISLYKSLSLDFLDYFPPAEISQIRDLGYKANSALNAILGADSSAGLDRSNQARLVDNLRRCHDAQYMELLRLLSYQFSQDGFSAYKEIEESTKKKLDAADRTIIGMRNQVNSLLEKLSDAQDKTNTEMTRFSAEQDAVRKDVSNSKDKLDIIIKSSEKTLNDVRSIAAKESVARQARYFSSEAKRHFKFAIYWGGATAILAVCLLAYVSIVIPLVEDSWWGSSDTIQILATKFLIFVTLGFALLFSARNYMAHNHNAIVNRHKQNALSTYRVLVSANSHPENADIILAEAARFIFAPQDSGFIQGKGGGSDISILPAMMREARKINSN